MTATPEQIAKAKAGRIKEVRRMGRIRAQPCPKCNARIGEDCMSSGGWVTQQPHVDRITAAGVRR